MKVLGKLLLLLLLLANHVYSGCVSSHRKLLMLLLLLKHLKSLYKRELLSQAGVYKCVQLLISVLFIARGVQ